VAGFAITMIVARRLNENDAAMYSKQLSLDVMQRFTWIRAFDEYAQLNGK
jgi:hypothetical protein